MKRFLPLAASMTLATSVSAAPHTVILTHGFTTGEKGAWLEEMAAAIIARAGTGTVYRYLGDAGHLTEVPVAGADGSDDVIIVIYNWVAESASPSPGPNRFFTQAGGDALAGMLRDPTYTGASGPADLCTGRDLHFIGHSRGPSLISSAVRVLGGAGIPVDHVTNLDPHPVNGTLDAPYDLDWSDEPPVRWSNVAFAETIWRADGGGIFNGLDFDGIPLADTHNIQLSESALNCCAYSFAHLDVHLWYHGTIDHSDTICDGEECLDLSGRLQWYPAGWTNIGFAWSAIAGGQASRPAMPGAGTDPGAPPILYNGGFTQGSYAGWRYHGGAGSGAIVSLGAGHALRLTDAAPDFTHNRFYLPAPKRTLRWNIQPSTALNAGVVRAEVIPASGLPVIVAEQPLAGIVPGTMTPFAAALPPSAADRRVKLRLSLVGAPAGATVHLDDVAFSETVEGDATLDGTVNLQDLLVILAGWGSCSSPCPPACAGDLNGDCAVDLADLLLVLANWT